MKIIAIRSCPGLFPFQAGVGPGGGVFSIKLNSSYMPMAMTPTTIKPLKARAICMEEPAGISR